jgi:hypothetical protein
LVLVKNRLLRDFNSGVVVLVDENKGFINKYRNLIGKFEIVCVLFRSQFEVEIHGLG